MVDKDYCMSSYLALRFVEDENKNFFEGIFHKNIKLPKENEKIVVKTAKDIDNEIKKVFFQIKGRKKGILLSGGMDSAILASYMKGCDAYTFRFLGGKYQAAELHRAEYYAKYYNLKLHYVDISWDTVEKYLEPILKKKASPVHSIEPQILQAALQAKGDGIEIMILGESSDGIFGGMDQLLSKDWDFDEFVKRYIFLDPREVLKHPVDIQDIFERYRKGKKIDFLSFMDEVFDVESSSSYLNAFEVAEMKYIDPYFRLKMGEKLDLKRIRAGESKYLIRELFSMKYPEIEIPEKVPMPRPVDLYFSNWKGPIRKEFKNNLDMKKFTGNQKWQMYCLEQFLNLYDK